MRRRRIIKQFAKELQKKINLKPALFIFCKKNNTGKFTVLNFLRKINIYIICINPEREDLIKIIIHEITHYFVYVHTEKTDHGIEFYHIYKQIFQKHNTCITAYIYKLELNLRLNQRLDANDFRPETPVIR